MVSTPRCGRGNRSSNLRSDSRSAIGSSSIAFCPFDVVLLFRPPSCFFEPLFPSAPLFLACFLVQNSSQVTKLRIRYGLAAETSFCKANIQVIKFVKSPGENVADLPVVCSSRGRPCATSTRAVKQASSPACFHTACTAICPTTTRSRVVSRAQILGIGKWEFPTPGKSWELGIPVNWELPKKPSGTIRKSWKVIFFSVPRNKSGNISGKVTFFQGNINISQRDPENVNHSFQNWLFISRWEFPTK